MVKGSGIGDVGGGGGGGGVGSGGGRGAAAGGGGDGRRLAVPLKKENQPQMDTDAHR